MPLQTLIDRFADCRELPIEIPEVRDAIIAQGFQDEIVFVPENIDPGKLRGLFYQYIKRKVLYGEPQLCTLIIYSGQLPIEWQRLVCGKELIHVLDARAEQTRTDEEVQGLIDKLLGPLSTEDFGLADFMAAKDKLALYQALPILFPAAARADAVRLIQEKRKTVEQIAGDACLPVSLTRLVVSPNWPDLQKDLCAG